MFLPPILPPKKYREWLRNPAPVENGGKHPILFTGFQPSSGAGFRCPIHLGHLGFLLRSTLGCLDLWNPIPSGYLTVRHGKSTHF